MLCLEQVGGGFIVADPQPVEIMGCTYLIVQPSELPPSPFQLTPAEGAQIAGAIAVVWAIGFAARAAVYAIKNERNSDHD